MPARKPQEEMPAEVRKQVERLKEPDARTKEDAAFRLSELAHPSAISHLVEAIQVREKYVANWRTLHSAVQALENTEHPDATRALLQLLNDKRLKVREWAAISLATNKQTEAVEPLKKALVADKRYGMKAMAAWALGEFEELSAIPQLGQALQEKNWDVSTNAASALVKIGKGLQGKTVEEKDAKALQLVAKHLQPDEWRIIAKKALLAALAGKINEQNARLYIKQLRAMKGNVK